MRKSSVKKPGRAAKSAKSVRGSVKKSAKLPHVLAKKAKALRHSSLSARVSSRSHGVTGSDRIIHTASPPMQPMTAQDIVLHSHKYQVGEVVYYTSPSFGRAAATGSYTVVKLLPSEGDDHQYRIKNNTEAFERVAKESQLDRA